MYYLLKVGVYDHGVFWIGDNLEEGIEMAKHAANLDRDDYHEWEVRVYKNPDENTNYCGDMIHDTVFSVSKNMEK